MLGNGLCSSEQISFKEAKPAPVPEEFNVTLKTYPPDLCPKRCCLMDAASLSLPCSTPAPSTEAVCSLSRHFVFFFSSGHLWCFTFILKVLLQWSTSSTSIPVISHIDLRLALRQDSDYPESDYPAESSGSWFIEESWNMWSWRDP